MEEVRRLYRNNNVPRQALAAEFLLDEGKGNIVHESAGRHEGKIIGATWARATDQQ
jgi:hypothetical protein